jgi:hypothetical protein
LIKLTGFGCIAYGAVVFYDPKSNSYPYTELSPGRHEGKQFIPNPPAMPDARADILKALNEFSRQNLKVGFLALFHTHPDFRGGDSRSVQPTAGDVAVQRDFGIRLGIIRSSKGYGFYNNFDTFGPDDPRANDCIWNLPKPRR